MQVCSCSMLLLTHGWPPVVLWSQLIQPACSRLSCAFWDVHVTVLLSYSLPQIVHCSRTHSRAALRQEQVIA